MHIKEATKEKKEHLKALKPLMKHLRHDESLIRSGKMEIEKDKEDGRANKKGQKRREQRKEKKSKKRY